MAGQILGPFELQQQLGAGGMGVVFRARYAKTGQIVALKLLSPALCNDAKLVARFQRELDVLKKLKHPNIVQCFGGGKLGEQRFFIMELVEGGSLADLMRQKKRLAWEETIHYGIQICDALQHAHENGIVHRDLKPGNLMLDKNGVLKLADFGLARVADATAITAAGKTLGTFAYMSPEQITGDAAISPKTDLYALGCVLYEFLIGTTPFHSDTAAQLFYQHLKKKPPRVCTEVLDCPIWLENIIHQLLEKDPDKRPRDAMAVSQALREVSQMVAANVGVVSRTVAGEPSAVTMETNVHEVSKLLRKKKKKRRDKGAPIYEKTWFLVACLILLCAGIGWSMLPLSEEQLFRRATPLMASDDPVRWNEAREDYLDELQRRFPEGKHAAEVQEFVDKVEMHNADDRIKNRIRRGLELKTEGERLYADAYKYEQFQDRITALEKYQGMIQVLQNRPEDRPFVNLARRQVALLQQATGGRDDRLHVVNDALTRAETLYQNGQALEAQNTWRSIISLYGGNRELEPQVRRAQARLAGKSDAADPGTEADPEPADPATATDAELETESEPEAESESPM